MASSPKYLERTVRQVVRVSSLYSPLGQSVCGEGRSVVGGQRDQMMENSSHTRGFGLESFYFEIRGLTEGCLVVLRGHEETPFVAGHVLPSRLHLVVDLLTEVQGPVKGRTVVIDQFSRRDLQSQQNRIMKIFLPPSLLQSHLSSDCVHQG